MIDICLKLHNIIYYRYSVVIAWLNIFIKYGGTDFYQYIILQPTIIIYYNLKKALHCTKYQKIVKK